MIDHSTSELPDNDDEQPVVCPCCNELKCDCFGSDCSICHKCQGHCTGPQEHTPERICLLPQDQIKLVSVDGQDILGTLEMDERERIAFCLRDDPGRNLAVQTPPHDRREQLTGLRGREAFKQQLRKAREFIPVGQDPRGKENGHRISIEAPGGECERLR